MTESKKHIVVLSHADSWGAESANRVVKHLHDNYPNVSIHLIVSKATRNKDGEIITKLDDLKTFRELKETDLAKYFDKIDAIYTQGSPLDNSQHAENYTYKKLAELYCEDGLVHYTSRGGPKGGEEAAEVFYKLEERGISPEVVLSVDTMAILPAEITGHYHCFSTHPGPLDNIKIEGMQGTERSLSYYVLYEHDGTPRPAYKNLFEGSAYVKGTLFMQHPELDKGPPIETVLAPAVIGMCSCRIRDELYYSLTEAMQNHIPVFLDKEKRTKLVEEATRKKEEDDKLPHKKIPDLENDKFAKWQTDALGVPDNSSSHGVAVLQNEIVSPIYFQNQMRRYFPGNQADFEKTFKEIFGKNLEKIEKQKYEHTKDDMWLRFYSNKEEVIIKVVNHRTGYTAIYNNNKNGGEPEIINPGTRGFNKSDEPRTTIIGDIFRKIAPSFASKIDELGKSLGVHQR